MTALDHATAGWANGPALLAWLEAAAEIRPGTESVRRRINRWRGGAQASFWDVDELLTSVGLHVSQVPCDVWCPYNNGRTRYDIARAAA